MKEEFEITERGKRAREYFLSGYNCSQAVILAFEDILPLGRDELLRLASPFGGGMGRLREVCGTVSAAFMIVGLIYGYPTPETGEVKAGLYARVQEIARRVENVRGSIVCRDLLGLAPGHDAPTPEARTAEYYERRPCPDIVAETASVLEGYINENAI